MIDFEIKGTAETPTIEFSSTEGVLLIKGRAIPENSVAFFKSFFDVFEGYVENPQPKTEVNFELEYFNTSSSKSILDILRLLQKIHMEGNSVSINWFYDEDDDEILEIGQDFSHIVNIPFNIKVNDN